VAQVVNELKARRSLILTNVGFRRQLVRFARCRGLLDLVERPSRRRSPRLEPGQGTPRGISPSRDETAEEPGETGDVAVKETTGNDGAEVPPPARNGYHITAPAPAILDLRLNGIQSSGLRPRPGTSHRERLLRDVDSTIEALSLYEDTDASSHYYSCYRPRDDSDGSARFYIQAPSSSYIAVSDYTPDPAASVPSVPVLLSSSDSEDDFTTSAFVSDR